MKMVKLFVGALFLLALLAMAFSPTRAGAHSHSTLPFFLRRTTPPKSETCNLKMSVKIANPLANGQPDLHFGIKHSLSQIALVPKPNIRPGVSNFDWVISYFKTESRKYFLQPENPGNPEIKDSSPQNPRKLPPSGFIISFIIVISTLILVLLFASHVRGLERKMHGKR